MAYFKKLDEVPPLFVTAVSKIRTGKTFCSYYQEVSDPLTVSLVDPDRLYMVGTDGQGGSTFLLVFSRTDKGVRTSTTLAGPPSLAEEDIWRFLADFSRTVPPAGELRSPKSLVPSHHLKSWPEFFEMVVAGTKPYELRYDKDRHFKVGDLVYIHEWRPFVSDAPVREADCYTGRSVCGTVLSVGRPSEYHVQEDYVVMGMHWHYLEVVCPGEPPTVEWLGGGQVVANLLRVWQHVPSSRSKAGPTLNQEVRT
jgi:hypothetical protein